MPQPPASAAGELLTPRAAAMLLLRCLERCDEAERRATEELRDIHPDIGSSVGFTERFVEIVREVESDQAEMYGQAKFDLLRRRALYAA